MQTINKKDLIPLLSKSYLADQFEEEVVIPDKYVFKNFKKKIVYQIVIEDENDFNLVMEQLRFHMVKELPYEVYDYVSKNKPDLSNFKDFFFEELTLLKKGKVNLMNKCAENGHLNLIKYLRKIGYNWSTLTCSSAARYGHLECLKYLHQNKCPLDMNTFRCAARNGNLKMIKYLHKNKCRWDYSVCSWTVLNIDSSSLDCLKYLYENRCPWNSTTCIYSCCNGNLDCLKYAIENGCLYDKQECIDEAKEHKHIVEYLQSI